MAPKLGCTQKSKICMSLPPAAVRHSITRDTLPREHAKELFAPSKDSRIVVVLTEKNFLRLGFGSFGGCCQKEGRFCFFCGFMSSSPGQ